jgi:Xaa-Pro dipeptidase
MSLALEARVHLEKVRVEMRRRGIKALYVNEEADLRYLTHRETGRLLIRGGDAVLWVKDLYLELYDDVYSSRGYPLDVRLYDKDALRDELRSLRSKAISVTSPAIMGGLKKISKKKVDSSDVVKSARSVKTKWELEMIMKSCRIAKAGMKKAREVVSVGVRELDAVAEVEAEIRRRGSEKAPFGGGMLLASGKGGADIHAKAFLRRIGDGPVVVDLGAVYNGYNSDMTRTLGVGSLTKEEKKVMNIVRSLRDEAIWMIRPGMMASDIHKFVDEGIKAAGYKFHHLSGHGVGLEIHEQPSFSPENNVRLAPNMVFTVEPGIYLPGKFGVRFEDTVLLRKNGCMKLT